MATTTWPAEVYVFDGTRWVSISPHGMTSLPPATGTTLGGVIAGSGVNVAPDGTISVTHFSGDYNDLINKPIVAAPVQSDWNSAGGDSYILNKPVALSQFSNDLKISDFPNDALYTTVPQAAAAAPVQSIVAGANVAISDDGHGHITIASTGTGSGPGGGITSVSGSAPIKVVGGTSAPVISLNVGAGLKVNAGALEADVPDASTTTKGIIQIADAASITAGTALRAVDAAGLKAVTDQQTKDFVNVSGDTMTGTLVIPDGTAAAPSLKFDDATGLFQPAGNTWAVSTAGSERVRIDNAGNVGIGRTAPASALDVNGVITVSAGTAASPSVCASGDGDSGLWFPAANAVSLSTSGLERLRVDSIGRVGIGTNPSYVMHVNGAIATTTGDVYVLGGGVRVTRSSNPFILFTEGAAGVGQIRASSSQLRMTDAAGTSVFFALDTGSGSLGLGTTTPASRLDVNGVITVAAGTAAAPAIVCGKGASDSGIFWPATNAVAISTVGSERLRVKSTGGVKYVPLATAPATPEEGEVYFDSTTKKLRVYDGTAWADLH